MSAHWRATAGLHRPGCQRPAGVSRSLAPGRRAGAPAATVHPATRRRAHRGEPAEPHTATPARPPPRHPAGRSPAETPASGQSGRATTTRPGRPQPWPDAAPAGRGAAAGQSSHSQARSWPDRGAIQPAGGGPRDPGAPRCPPSAQPPAVPPAASRSCLPPPRYSGRSTRRRGLGSPALPPERLDAYPGWPPGERGHLLTHGARMASAMDQQPRALEELGLGRPGSRPPTGRRARPIGSALLPWGHWPAVLVSAGPELALTDPAEQAAQPHEPGELLDAPFRGRGNGQRSATPRRGLGPRRPRGCGPGPGGQHAERGRVDLELDWGVDHDRLAIDANLQLAAGRVDLEAGRGPARPALARPVAT